MQNIGILGAGQLGQMLALAGYPLGQRFTFLDTTGSPSADIGTTLIDLDTTQQGNFLAAVDVITYEFEHLPLAVAQSLEKYKPMYPSSRALQVCQNRGLEKALFTQLGIATPEYKLVNSLEELTAAHAELGTAASRKLVVKTTTQGYDGKGQAVLSPSATAEDLASCWQQLSQAQKDTQQLIVEAFVDFQREVSLLAVRGQQGELAFYPLAENHHEDGILRFSQAPLNNLAASTQEQAEAYITKLLNELNYVGVLALELFELADGSLMANEIAPRVHNSGHWTQNGAATSQFENHLRAVAGLPLGSTQAQGYSCMVNIIGEAPNTAEMLKIAGAQLHLYGKEPRAGRKLGHINLVANSLEELQQQLEALQPLMPNQPAYKLTQLK